MRRLILCLAACVLAVAGCGDANRGPLVSAQPRTGLTWTSWEAFVGSYSGEDTTLFFTFVTEGLDTNPEFTDFRLETDRGPIRAEIRSLDPGTSWIATRLFTIGVAPLDLHNGSYRFETIAVTDGQGRMTRYAVGSWHLEVVDPELEQPFVTHSVTVGADPIGEIELELTNMAKESVRITGIEANLPRRDVTFAPYGDPGETGQGTTFAAGERKIIGFMPTAGAPEPRFVFVKPFILYQIDNEAETRRLAILPQVWAPVFESDADLRRYLDSLPAEASGAS